MNGENVRVIQGRRRLGFLFESTQAVLVPGKIRGQQLESDLAPQPGVFGQVDFTHPARPESGDEFVMLQPGSRLDRHLSTFALWTQVISLEAFLPGPHQPGP